MDSLIRLAGLLAALLPVAWIGLMLLYAARDRLTKEAAATAFAAGLMSALTMVVSNLLSRWLSLDTTSLAGAARAMFTLAAFPEEAARLLILLTIVFRHEGVQDRWQRTVAAGWLGLGFAALENLLYVIGEEQWLLIAGLRAMTAVPSHVVAGLLMGALLARASEDSAKRLPWIATAFLCPMLLHGLYDTLVIAPKTTRLPGFPDWNPIPLAQGAVLAIEAWLAVIVLRRCGNRQQSQPEFLPTKARMLRKLAGTSTALIAVLLICAGVAFTLSGFHQLSVFIGAGLAWLGLLSLVGDLHKVAAPVPNPV